MPRIDPGSAEVSINLKHKDGIYRRTIATIDSGAAVSLLPANLLDELDYRLSATGKVTIEQAGIAQQTFEATEAFVTLTHEDQYGAESSELEARTWFAGTKAVLIGFDGILDRAILHVDMTTHTGWIEID